MTRNTERRIEVACPVLNPVLANRIVETLETGFVDNTKARLMTPDGSYKRPCAPGDEPGMDSQIAFYKRAYLMAGNEFCEGK